MLIKKPTVGFNYIGFAILIAAVQMSNFVWADSHFHMEKDRQGFIVPFKAVSVPLAEFVREYMRITSTQIVVGGNWDQQLKGSVTLFLRHHLKQDELTDIFHRVLGENGYAVVDGSEGNGWMIEKQRDARDDALPLYEISEVPDSSRLINAYHDLKYVTAESVARMMRSFMPANSRIVPTSKSQIFITDTASNIRKLNSVILRMDTPEAEKRQREASSGSSFGPARSCGEQRIEKLVVEKLEIQDSGNSIEAPGVKIVREGGRK